MTGYEQRHWKKWTDVVWSLPVILIGAFLGPGAILVPYAGYGRYSK